jgi:DNA gyrase subunit B
MIEDRSQGYPRQYEIGIDFITSGEYRTLAAAYQLIQEIRFPVVVKATEAVQDEVDEDAKAASDNSAIGGAPVDEATKLAAEPKPSSASPEGQVPTARSKKDPDVALQDLDAFVEFFITAGKKGIAINRYKGLGEMNPDTLWTTTMDPENRTLLQVRAEDHAEADQMFTTLMGDQVEPRRKFIEDHALDVRNLDV